LANDYGVGYIQQIHSLQIIATATNKANVGAVDTESEQRRYFGTWHTSRDGNIRDTYKVNYSGQDWVFRGEIYPFQRSDAADIGLLVPDRLLQFNYSNDSDIRIKVDPSTVAVKATQVPPNPAFPNQPPGQFIIERTIPQYYIEKNCIELKSQFQDLVFNQVRDVGYRSLDQIDLFLDVDSIVVRPFAEVTFVVSYNSYLIILSEDSANQRVVGGGQFALCLPSLPYYPPPDPSGITTQVP
jgi:hypothetical protein